MMKIRGMTVAPSMAALAAVIAMLAATPAAAGDFAPTKRLPSDPPRIPLTLNPPLYLPSEEPEQLIRAIYARKSPFMGKVSGYRRAFMPDLARAIAQDLQPGEVGVLDFDWRYGGRAKQARHVRYVTKSANGIAEVTVHFRLRGKPRTTVIQMFERRSGWRIHDVVQIGDAETQLPSWSIRACLHMRGATLTKLCEKPARDNDALTPDMTPIILPKPKLAQPAPPPSTTPPPAIKPPAALPTSAAPKTDPAKPAAAPPTPPPTLKH